MQIDDVLKWMTDRAGEDDITEMSGYLTGIADAAGQLDSVRASADAKVTELNDRITALDADNQNLKAKNYDLLMQVPADDSPIVDAVADDGEVYHIDNLFEEAR